LISPSSLKPPAQAAVQALERTSNWPGGTQNARWNHPLRKEPRFQVIERELKFP